MAFSFLFAIFAVLAVTVSSTPRRASAVHDQRGMPQYFTVQGSASDDTTISFRIGLTPRDREGLEKALYNVSTPGRELYRQHLSYEEVKAFAAPTEETVSAVTNWLIENGIANFEVKGAYGDWIWFDYSASDANALFDANYQKFIHADSGEELVRTLEYSLPLELFEHVRVVHPTTGFAGALRRQNPVLSTPITPRNITSRADPAPSSCDAIVTPACLQALYGIPTEPATQSSNRLAVSGFIQQFAREADLEIFLTELRPDMDPSTTFDLQTIDNGQNPQGAGQAGVEANLDIQYTVGTATGVPVVFISVGDDNSDRVSGFLDIIDFLNDQDDPPQVLTTSYGFDEPDLGPALASTICDSYMTLGARGVSILFSSGDGGVAGGQSQSCTTFITAFPGTCPFSTAVGGTFLVDETSADFSSGGFSDVFAQPDYQVDAVNAYLESLGDTNAGLYNTTGRGFPDISLQSEDFEIVVGDEFFLVSGTSCSSPSLASMFALVNDRLIAAGQPVLGFLNPFLYANPQIFFDITSGSNPGCGTNGFPATEGWDPVTGLGTPNFDALLAAVGL